VSWDAELLLRLRQVVSSECVLRAEEPLAKRTTLRVGGPADCYAEPASEADLAAILQLCAERGEPITLLGRGSNLLIRDGGIRGVVISLAHANFSRLEIQHDRLRAGAGLRLKLLAQEARRAGLGGLEFLEGIPGSLGGALRMNAGAQGFWMFDVVESVRCMDRAGHVEERPARDLPARYRGCPFFVDHVALGAVLRGVPERPDVIAERMSQFSQRRWETQPAAPSAGCIFKNPPSIPAGKLIDELGLKGARVGGAVVSDMHANFIVNEGAATAHDVLQLIDLIRDKARRERAIELETEVEILGEAARHA
jgi:UDP-N-acetylenolpyruvoylglucosamine reductase